MGNSNPGSYNLKTLIPVPWQENRMNLTKSKHRFTVITQALVATVLMMVVAVPSSKLAAQQIVPEADKRFGSVTWMQKSAEYRLLTEQTYRFALMQLTNGIHDGKWTADEYQLAAGGFEDKTPAVILDVDETVLDNSPFNARNILQGKSYAIENWNAWCLEEKADAIPGALDFVKGAEGLGVQVFYITNREDDVKEATIRNLNKLGFKATAESLFTKNESEGRGDNKISRRASVAEKHRIVLLIGDSMSDLCEGMDVANTKRRNELAAQKKALLGTRWIMIPNPAYGGWERGLPKGKKALDAKLKDEPEASTETPEPATPGSIVDQLKQEVSKVNPLLKGEWTRSWIARAAQLPAVKPKTVTAGDKEVVVDESMFYVGRYGSPLAYARGIDLAEQHGFSPQEGARVFDFGYGSIGHLRMLALAGLQVTAVDVDPLLPVIYGQEDGPLGSGSVNLLNGKFPAEAGLVEKAGDGYDLFLSKNTLKRGYIHPAREPASPKHIIELGVADEEYLNAVAKMLKPGGLFVIYNFCPPKAAADKPYVPWADGESPFTKEQFEKAGFEVLELSVVDDAAARELAKSLGWDASMKLETDLFAWYTIAKKN